MEDIGHFSLDTLLDFIDLESERLKENVYYEDREKLILARTIKIMEEVGELCDDVLSSLGLQRKEKLEKYTTENLEDEFADVIFVTLLLANTMNINIEEALKRKGEKVNKYYDQNNSNNI